MAIEGLYEDSENTGSPIMRRRSSVRKPLSAISKNMMHSPAPSSTAKAMQKPSIIHEAPPATPMFSIDPEVSPWTVPDSPVRCPLDEKEIARKRSRAHIVMPALAIGAVLSLLAAPYIMNTESLKAPQFVHSAPHSELDVATDGPPLGPRDDVFDNVFSAPSAQPVEISSDDTTELTHMYAQGPEDPAVEEETNEPFATSDDDWAPLSVDNIDSNTAGSENTGRSDEVTVSPWEAAIMSGPLHIPQKSEDAMPEFAGFSRMTPDGELYLFEQADSEVPMGMLSLDGCKATGDVSGTCFEINSLSGPFTGCVGDEDEAQDWVWAARQLPCDI